MKQPDPLNPYLFEVKQGESVSITMTAMGTNDLVEASLDGDTLTRPFEFLVTKVPPHRHVVAMQFDFDPDHTATAKYTWQVSGGGGDSFSLPEINANTSIKDPGLSFKVVA